MHKLSKDLAMPSVAAHLHTIIMVVTPASDIVAAGADSIAWYAEDEIETFQMYGSKQYNHEPDSSRFGALKSALLTLVYRHNRRSHVDNDGQNTCGGLLLDCTNM